VVGADKAQRHYFDYHLKGEANVEDRFNSYLLLSILCRFLESEYHAVSTYQQQDAIFEPTTSNHSDQSTSPPENFIQS